jgi:shikimate dehydrogenase
MTILTGSAMLAGVIGWPVAHSRSPLLHNTWLKRYGIDGAYVPLAVAPKDIATAVTGLRAAGFRGANVTIPHKEAALAVCDVLDDTAREAGAVNTLVFKAGAIYGSNTDGAGFIDNLRAHGAEPSTGPALLLGAGGAARAIAASLLRLGVPVTIANRSPDRAEALAACLPGLKILRWTDRHAAIADQALLVNTTAAGMQGAGGFNFDFSAASPTLTVADIVYVPLRTSFLRNAQVSGLRTVSGLGMLLHQAVPGFSAWFGVTPTVDDELASSLSADIPPE